MIKKLKYKLLAFIQEQITRPITKEINLENLLLQNGRVWSHLIENMRINSLEEVEFKVFSQWGDDGIIQYLVKNLDIEHKEFIEFGAEDYLESNTRFLLMNNNWSGLVMDGSADNISKIKRNDFYWKYDLIAKNSFITAENINQLIKEEGFHGQIGLVHIDIDGNDYWVWKALDIVDPIIVVIEYNSIFGDKRSITIPYNSTFNRTDAHSSNLYAGASITSLCDLGEKKGYSFIGCNSAGNNAYFVKKQYLKTLKSKLPNEGFVLSKFRESRDDNGQLTYIRGVERLKVIKGLSVYNTRTNKIEEL